MVLVFDIHFHIIVHPPFVFIALRPQCQLGTDQFPRSFAHRRVDPGHGLVRIELPVARRQFLLCTAQHFQYIAPLQSSSSGPFNPRGRTQRRQPIRAMYQVIDSPTFQPAAPANDHRHPDPSFVHRSLLPIEAAIITSGIGTHPRGHLIGPQAKCRSVITGEH